MSLFLAKRFAIFLATLAGTTVITFLALEILPGDPARVILGVEAPDSAVQALREQLGLDRPALERYLDWVGSLATGSFVLRMTSAGIGCGHAQQVVKGLGVLPAIGVEVALIRGEDAAFAKLGRRHDQ